MFYNPKLVQIGFKIPPNIKFTIINLKINRITLYGRVD